MLKRIVIIFIARNKEYFRDREAFWWNFIFPFLIIVGFAVMFQEGMERQYKYGAIPPASGFIQTTSLSKSIENLEMVRIVPFENREEGFEKLIHHKIDLLFESGSKPIRYWINTSSPKGLIAESLLIKSLSDSKALKEKVVKDTVDGQQIDYIDWLFPGIIAMNMMFSALYGVGYVIVRYRKNGVLKRLKATPLTPFEYLSAQVLSRMFLLVISSGVVYAVCAVLFDFQCVGSYGDLILIFCLGSSSNIALGLIVAARTDSEEFANGILNLIAWPMMFLSEVWFSLEGSPEWVRLFAQIFPLSHVTEGMRQIMNDGATLGDLSYQIAALTMTTVIFMIVGSLMFKWMKS
jgi:ABC-type multidrug transport system permease subunit